MVVESFETIAMAKGKIKGEAKGKAKGKARGKAAGIDSNKNDS